MARNIVLLGMMGAGKSTIGKILDTKFDGFSFVDIDYEIEKKEKCTIVEIFKTHGEATFRSIEEKMVKEYSAYKNMVISTGGGVVERLDNIKCLQKNGVLFYLSANPKTLLERIEHTSDRPLLAEKDPLKTIVERLAKRKTSYMMADFEVTTENKDIMTIVNEILELYKYYEKSHC